MPRELSLPRRLLAVFLGGFLGTIIRYLLSLAIQNYLGKNWPYDILTINLTGAFLLALFTTLADAAIFIGPTRRLLINVGFLGAYTTFSSLALSDILLTTHDQWLPALLYLLLSIIGGLLAILLGTWCAQTTIKKTRQAFAQKTAPELITVPLQTPLTPSHTDINDDLLYPQPNRRDRA